MRMKDSGGSCGAGSVRLVARRSRLAVQTSGSWNDEAQSALEPPAYKPKVGEFPNRKMPSDGEFRDPNGRLREPSGRFADDFDPFEDPAEKYGPVHNNSLSTTTPARGYVLVDKEGNILKYGETTQGESRYSRKWLKEHNAVIWFKESGTKAEMHEWQHQQILEYKKTHGGQRPPWNKNDW